MKNLDLMMLSKAREMDWSVKNIWEVSVKNVNEEKKIKKFKNLDKNQ